MKDAQFLLKFIKNLYNTKTLLRKVFFLCAFHFDTDQIPLISAEA